MMEGRWAEGGGSGGEEPWTVPTTTVQTSESWSSSPHKTGVGDSKKEGDKGKRRSRGGRRGGGKEGKKQQHKGVRN